MSYTFDSIFKDSAFWKRILVYISLFIAYLDFEYELLGGNVGIVLLILGGVSLLVLVIKNVSEFVGKRKRKETQELFERKQRMKFRNIIRKNQDFKTFCFDCKHFDIEKRICKIRFEIINKKAFKTLIKGGKLELCLYWEKKI